MEVVKNLLSKEPLGTGQVLQNVGYGKIGEHPARIVNSDGFQQALQETGLRQALEAQGVNPQKIAQKIKTLLDAKSLSGEDDYNAIDKGLKHATAIYGITDPDKPKSNTGNTYNFIFSQEVQSKIKVVEDEIKSLLTRKHAQED